MAVGSASDRSSQDDTIRRQRETYQKNETDEAKKNAAKVKQLAEAHQAEIEQLKQEHAREIEELKQKTRDAFTRRDMEYQSEINDIRDMHTKQLQRLATDGDQKNNSTKTALQAEIDRTRNTNEQQKNLLKSSYEDQLTAKDKALEDYAVSSRQQQSTATADLRNRLNEAHKKEVDLLGKDRDQKMTEAAANLSNTRRAADIQVRQTERQRENEVNRLTTMNEVAVKNEKENNRQMMDDAREQLAYGVQKNRERYEEATQKVRDENLSAREDLSKTVNDRLNDQVTSLKAENTNLKNDNVRQRVKLEHENSRQQRDIRDALGANIENLESNRKEIVNASNKKTAADIAKINKAKEEALKTNNDFHNERKSMDDLRNEERYMKAESDYKKTFDHEKTMNDSRFEKLKNANELEQGKLSSYFDRASGSMKENFDNQLRDMRDRNKRDQDIMFSSFTKQAQETDQKFQNKLGDVSLAYEKKIAEIQEQNQKDMKDQSSVAERQKGELAKKADLDLKTQASQYEYRISKMEEKHKRELDAVNRKFEETLANLTKTKHT